MLKRFTFFLLLAAYTIMLGHNIIPHHHHHDQDHTAVHDHHEDDHEDEDSDAEHLLAFYEHPSEGISVTLSHDSSEKLEQEVLFTAYLQEGLSLRHLRLPPLIPLPPEVERLYISPYSGVCGLRAPPMS